MKKNLILLAGIIVLQLLARTSFLDFYIEYIHPIYRLTLGG